MPGPQDAMDAGLAPADKEFLDLKQAQVLKEPKLPSEHALRREQIGMQNQQTPPTPPPVRSPADHVTPRFSENEFQSPVAGNKPADTVVVPQEAPPITPKDSPRVQDRINKLFGKMKSAEERAQDAEMRLAEVMRQNEARFQPPQPPQNYGFPPAHPTGFEPTPISSVPDAGLDQQPFVSRQELANIMAQQTRLLLAQNEAMHARTTSRTEAERDFPDVFTNPELRDAYEHIIRTDSALQNDPHGPQKAAAMVRGLNAGVIPSDSGLPTTARKEAIASSGPSVPEGQAQPDDRAARYQAALARYQSTGRMEDAVYARRIQLGQA